jgi:ubiquinone/menaquinone biosynthesis C-methylase UbiE
MDPSNRYTRMQKAYYDNEGITGNMNKVNHMNHNENPDYWNILVGETQDEKFLNKLGLDFGCGCGRNVMNLYKRFNRMDGVDISPELIATCNRNLSGLADDTKYKFYTCNGISLDVIQDDVYDFVMSTIVLQHICVHDIRYNYLKEFYRVMKSGGVLSIQLGFGNCPPHFRDYFDNYYDATGTNSICDVRITDPNNIIEDLTEIGFKNITYTIRPAWDGPHDEWIFVRAEKK